MKRLIASIILLLASAGFCHASATNVYVTQTGSDPGVGPCHGQAIISASTFNSSGEWGSGATQIGPGTTILFCNTYTGSANTQALLFQGSGTSGSPITFNCSNAIFTSPAWSNNSAIDTNFQSWLVLNGGGSSNCLINNTQNGTGLTYQQPSTGITVRGGSNVTVEGFTVSNICQHTSSSDSNACNSGGNNDQAIGIVQGATNVTIKQNIVHDSQNCIFYAGQNGDSGVSITDNAVFRCNWAIGVEQAGASSGLLIARNELYCVVASPCNWDDNSDAFHHNGVIIYPQSGDTLNTVVVHDNYIHDINGNVTAHIFLDPSGTGNTPGILIYNNVTFTTPGQGGPTNASINVGTGITGALVLNNTVSAPGAQGLSGQLTPTYENNIVSGPAYCELLNGGYSGVVSNFNIFYNCSSGFSAGGSTFPTLSSWQSSLSLDANSSNLNPSLTSTFTLNAGSPAIGKGVNLTSMGISGLNVGAPQTFGPTGSCGTGCVPRPATGNWDIGAYQSSGGTHPFGWLMSGGIFLGGTY